MMWRLSPALLVWIIRTLFCAAREMVPSTIPATSMRHRRIGCVLVIVATPSQSDALLQGLPKHPRLQCPPLVVVLRAPVLAAAVIEIAAGLFGERVNEESALRHAARHHDPPDRFEILACVLVVPRRGAGRKRLQPQGRAGPVARDASGMARTLGQKNRLHLGFEILV